MTGDTSKNRKSVNQLIQDLDDGIISTGDRENLMSLMRERPEVMELYIKHMKMVALLKHTASSRAELGTLPVSQDSLKLATRRGAMVSLVFGIAALAILGLFFVILQSDDEFSNDIPEWIVMDSSFDADFAITYHGEDARMQRELVVGDLIQLRQGSVRFKFPSGVEAIMEGPADITLVSESSVSMSSGQAWFRVPKAGHGFKVITSQCSVIDLGTEFGVMCDDEGAVQVHVAHGKVRVESVLKALRTPELSAGKAMQFDVYGRGSEIDYETSFFLKKFVQGMPYLHWSFDELHRGVYPAAGSMPGVQDYQAELRYLRKLPDGVAERECQVEGRFGKAFSMNGTGWYAQTAFPGIGGNAPRTFAAWIRHRADFSMPRTPYCSWGRRPSYGKSWKVHIWKRDGYELCTSAFGPARYTTMEDGIMDRWTHIASVYTGRKDAQGHPEIRHYINGVEQPAEVLDPKIKNVDTDISEQSTRLRFGAAFDVKEGGNSVDGDLDEAYLFRGILTEEQIRQLMNTNKLDFFLK